jgi:Telomere repeat binding factor (TRF)
MGQPSRDQSSILSDLFPSVQQLTYLFVARRTPQPIMTAPTHDDLTPAEVEFITKCERRREHLRSLGDSDAKVQELKESYSWETFLRELRGYVAKNWETIVGSRGGKPRRPTKKRVSADGPVGYMDLNSMPNLMQQEPPAPLPVQPATTQQTQPQTRSVPTALHESTTAVHIQEAYERARNAALPPTTVGPAGANLGTPSTGIPPPSPSTAPQVTPRPPTEGAGNQLRRPWSKEEGTQH